MNSQLNQSELAQYLLKHHNQIPDLFCEENIQKERNVNKPTCDFSEMGGYELTLMLLFREFKE
jgi:hypothetical protein